MDAEIRHPGYLPWQTEMLANAVGLKQQQRLPHAVLIESESKQDMTGFIWQLSMMLLCETPTGADFCGQCEACRMMQANTYADFRLVTLEHDDKSKKLNKNIKIEQIRNLIHEVHLTRRYSALKIAAIYPAERMSQAGANSLLKTLEEPADQVLLLLVTHNMGRIPITIRSRCQSWTLRLPTTEGAGKWLGQQGLEADEVTRYLAFAGGDAVLALELKEQDYASRVEAFKSQFSRYLRGEISVTTLCNGLLSNEIDLTRRLIDMMLSAYCYRWSGLDSSGNASPNANRVAAQAVLQLQLQSQRQLQIEENNLDLQLQLEDVLISFKQIITRRSD